MKAGILAVKPSEKPRPSQVRLVCDLCEKRLTFADPDCGKAMCEPEVNWARLVKAAKL